MLVNHFQEFILESEPLDLPLVRVVVSRSFDILFNAVYFFIGLVIFVEELGEVRIVYLELMNGGAVLGEFVDEVVFLDGHGFVCFSDKT